LRNGIENKTEPICAVGIETLWATIVVPPIKLKCISPFSFSGTAVCSCIDFSIIGFNELSVIIGGTNSASNPTAIMPDRMDQKNLRLYLGLIAISLCSCFFIIMD
jgi:hypothetical protein